MQQHNKLLAAVRALRRYLVRVRITNALTASHASNSLNHTATGQLLVLLQGHSTQQVQCRGSSTTSTSSVILPHTSRKLQTWLLHSIQGSKGDAVQQDEVCRTSPSCGRGLALAAVTRTTDCTAGSSAAPAAAAVGQEGLPAEATSRQSAAWQHVLQLLKQDSDTGDNSSSSSDGAPQQQTAQQQQHREEDLAAALAAAAADQAGPSAQQLLRLLVAASKAQQQLQQQLTSGLLPLLIEAAVANLHKLPPDQFAEALPVLKGLQSIAASSSSSSAGKGRTRAPADRVSAEQCTAQEAPSLAQSQLQSSGATKTPRQQAAVLTKAVRVYLQQQQQQMDASDTAAVAAALAACKQHSSFTIMSMLALEHMSAMAPAQMVQLLQAFADVQHYNRAVCDAAAQQAVESIKQQGYKLQPPADPVAAASAQQRQQQQHGFTADQLTSVLQALSRLRHYDSSLLEAACTCLLRSPQRSWEHTVSLVHTCAVLNHYHQPLFSTAVEMAMQAMQQQEQQQPDGKQQHQQEDGKGGSNLGQALAELSWACGVMGHWDAGFVHQLIAWSAQLDVKQLPADELLMWHEVSCCLSLCAGAQLLGQIVWFCSAAALTCRPYCDTLCHFKWVCCPCFFSWYLRLCFVVLCAMLLLKLTPSAFWFVLRRFRPV